MDGFQGRLSQSLQFRLSLWLSVMMVGFALGAGAYSFRAAFHEANDLQDDQLRQVAALLNNHRLLSDGGNLAPDIKTADKDAQLLVQVLKRDNGEMISSTLGMPALPVYLKSGIQTLPLQGEAWRVFVRDLPDGLRIVIGQRTEVRDELARDSAIHTTTPFLILIPCFLVLLGILLGQIFKPLKKTATELNLRTGHEVQYINPDNLPTEVLPFVAAVNQMLSRVQQSMLVQRRFLADAAHELRSPLTALSLQAERLANAEMSEAARERLVSLRDGIQRSRSLLDQLLALARAQTPAKPLVARSSLQRILREVLGDLMPLAEAKHIDIGVLKQADVVLAVSEIDLKTLLRNLIDNALRYTPREGTINLTIEVDAQHATLIIDDTGPGIPKEERARVFDPFYRVLGSDELGSGLGLAIAKAIIDRIGATLSLEDACDSTAAPGLLVRLVFPIDTIEKGLS